MERSHDEREEEAVPREPTPISPSGAERFGRRDFLKLVGTGAGLAVAGCGDERRYLFPYVVPARDELPGVAKWYATVCRECPAGCGAWARVREGRPVKLEGNPDHPVNRGKLCARGQGALLRLYDPDRLRGPERRTAAGWKPATWVDGLSALCAAVQAASAKGPQRVALLSGLETGALAGLFDRFARAFGGSHLMIDPHVPEALLSAHKAVFGRRDVPRFALERSDLVVALEADLFETFVSPVELMRQIVGPERPGGSRADLVFVGPRRGVTGILADEWLPARPGTAGHVALALLYVLDESHPAAIRGPVPRNELEGIRERASFEHLVERAGVAADDVRRLAGRLAAAARPVVLSGGAPWVGDVGASGETAAVLLAHALGAYGRDLDFGAPSALATASPCVDVRGLLDRARAGEIDVLLLHGANPVFDLPGGVDVEGALRNVPLIVSLSDRRDATSTLAHLALPAHSPLESWGDYAPRAGVEGLMQPVVAPLYDTRPAGDVLIEVARTVGRAADVSPTAASFEATVRERWAALDGGPAGSAADARFRDAQRAGGSFPLVPAESPRAIGAAWSVLRILARGAPGGRDAVRLAPFLPVRSGRAQRALGGWLSEVPEPTTAAVWGAPAEVHPELARRLGLSDGGTIEVRAERRSIRLPVVVRDAVHPDVVAVPLDGGPAGVGVSSLLPGHLWLGGEGLTTAGLPVTVTRAADAVALHRETRTFDRHRRGVVRARGIPLPMEEERENEELPRELVDMYEDHVHAGHRWGMAIDLDRCTGCSACIVACQAENNIAVVGPEAVDYGRESAWLQLHLYWERDPAGRALPLVSPVLCQHCDSAPCESVCPVFASYHTAEGLNAQVYNRCVGTRYCANNCPYKVRRFNWFESSFPPPLDLQLNPDVTVRSKGVMEKCTFCVQRIREAKERAKLERRALRDGEVRPACAQTCPTGAIVFGDLLAPGSEVSRLARSERGYRLLAHLGTRPSVTYLERVVRWGRG